MTPKRLLLRNLIYHWRGNTAVFLGVVVGTAVLTGALLVGDSLRGSLRDLALRRLGWVEEALVAPRFFRAALARELQSSGAAERVCPAILLQATVATETTPGQPRRQVRRVTVVGVDERFGFPEFRKRRGPKKTDEGLVWLNSTLAEALDVSPGAKVSLRLQKPSAIPRESLLGRKDLDALVQEWTLPVGRVLRDDEPGNHFSLRPSLEAPRTAFVPLGWLQAQLRKAGGPPGSQRDRSDKAAGTPGQLHDPANALLVAGAGASLGEQLHAKLKLADWGLVLYKPDDRAITLFDRFDRGRRDGKLEPREWRNVLAESVVRAIDPTLKKDLTLAQVEAYYREHSPYLTLESRQLLIEPFVGEAALAAAKDAGLRAAPTLVYVANTIAAGGKGIPYSVVAALDPAQAPPLGSFLPTGVKALADDQIVLADWKESPLPRKVGEEVILTFYPPEHQTPVRERSATFRLAGFVPLAGVSGDPQLTPEFPGITDQPDMSKWEPPFHYENQRIRPRDDRYWKEYRTTPKAYVNLAVGQQLWGSRFGKLTSVRLAPRDGTSLEASADAFEHHLHERLTPDKGGLAFDPVKANAEKASTNGTDFAQLFIGFSFFLIVAALLLVGLLFRLNLERRADEVGLLLAVGFPRRRVRWLLLGEGGVLAAAGAVVGCLAAMAYAGFLLQLLAALWPGGTLRSFLRPHYNPWSLIGGAAASFVVSVLTITWAVRVLGRVTPRALLAGQTIPERRPGLPRRRRWSVRVAGLSALGAAVLLFCAGRVRDHELKAMTFFGSGGLLLIAFLASVRAWMRAGRHAAVEGHGWGTVARLGVRNAARNPGRSLLTAGLLAAAAFLVVAVEAFRREASPGDNAPTSPDGGFQLLAESDLPLYRDLNTDAGRQELLKRLELQFQDALNGDPAEAQKRVREAEALLKETTVVAFRVRAGDDASCLNLYQPRRPRVLGVPQALIDRGGFTFAGAETHNDTERGNFWKILDETESPLPAFGEKNTVEWMLHGKLGGTINVPDAAGTDQPLRIDGMLQDSVFQSSVLVSEHNFLHLYPGHEGYNFFLIRTPPGKEAAVKRLLEQGLAESGFEVTATAERLQAYLAVENTYLTTFQALGGLGLILGSLGLAVVLLRAIWERRAELALLRALGFRRATLGWLVLAENGFLLLVGLGTGTVAALLAVSPHLLGGAGSIPWRELLILLALVLAVALTAGVLAVATTLRAPLVPALRRE